MTLNITLLTPTAIYQSADFRLTNGDTGALITDTSPKLVTLTNSSWSGFVTYTGIGKWAGSDLSEHIASWLEGRPDDSMESAADRIAAMGTDVLDRARTLRFGGLCPRHTFTLAGYEGGCARVFLISTFQDVQNRLWDPELPLRVTSADVTISGNALVVITGQSQIVTDEQRRLLKDLGAKHPLENVRVARRLSEITRAAAREPDSGGTVSEECSIASFGPWGTTVTLGDAPDAPVPSSFPQLLNGVNVMKQGINLLKSMGVQSPRIVQAVSKTFGPGAPTFASPDPCRFAVVAPEPTDYELDQIVADDFEAIQGRAISDVGVVVGEGREADGRPPWIPWLWRDGSITRLAFVGEVKSINDRGQVAAIERVPPANFSVAGVWKDGELQRCQILTSDAREFNTSDVSQIAQDGTVCGSIQLNIPGQGWRDGLPCVWRPDGTAIVPSAAPAGARGASAFCDSASVLVDITVGPFLSRPMRWTFFTDEWEDIGDPSRNILAHLASPDSHMVVGMHRLGDGKSQAVISEGGIAWTPITLPVGASPIGIGTSGGIVGFARIERLDRPWLRRRDGTIVWLPYISEHNCTANAISADGTIVGSASSGQCSHALIWTLRQ